MYLATAQPPPSIPTSQPRSLAAFQHRNITMPCNYKAPASQAAFEEFVDGRCDSGVYINAITGAELNTLYDALVWSPPLPHPPADEERNKRNLLAWILRNYPELANPSQKMPTKAILHSSMQERNLLHHMPVDRPQHTGPRRNTKSTRRQPQASLQSLSAPLSLQSLSLQPAPSPDAMHALVPDVAFQTLTPSPPPPKRRTRKSLPSFVQKNEEPSDDELASSCTVPAGPAPSTQAMHALVPDIAFQTLPTSPTPPKRRSRKSHPFSVQEDDEESSSEDKLTSPRPSKSAQKAGIPPLHLLSPSSTEDDDDPYFSDHHNRVSTIASQPVKPTIPPPPPPSSSSIATATSATIPQQNIQIPPPPPPPSPPAENTTTPPPPPRSPDLLPPLLQALDGNTATLRNVCLARNWDAALYTLATMTSLVVMVRDSGVICILRECGKVSFTNRADYPTAVAVSVWLELGCDAM
ncbi:uncharacterized protein MYCFIDRAFT_180369 [Pseudocercospora fijiensis CIRAD86]|uniref:Uncharacterized protein n=1 Tax=Pseudocercospora fijiensis (strain CIRAD86) TaxID=383855 RepID=M3AHP6_PSEFD|nr:uncharacterized protein MYCFIDRAFT_180369 [Pseudocercospora fijiensis CIRAD86]EME77037.1 hypothetical protein MYCFIDRAFT_180369 [Pseudocercospora fijiensis CIRAD86]